MTQKKQLEIIQKQFPEAGETEIRERLNIANRKFVRETRIIQDVASDTTVKDQLLYPFSNFTTSEGGVLLEATDISVENIKDQNLYWYIYEDKKQIAVGTKDYYSGEIEAVATTGKVIQVSGVFSDADYNSDLTAEPNYDSDFHMAPVYKVLADLHLEAGNINMNDRYEMKYKDDQVAAKVSVGSSGIAGNYSSYTD